MVERDQLVNHLHHLLEVDQFDDYCPNGLQVQGKSRIDKIITGVTACQALLGVAVEKQVDAVLVHHGYFWKNEQRCVVGMHYQRLKTLLTHDINLIAYHLPLDAHPIYGNNVQLAKMLDINVCDDMQLSFGKGVGLVGQFDQAIAAQQLVEKLVRHLDRRPLFIAGGNHAVKRIAWCSGGAQSQLMRAKECGADAYITGEASEPCAHIARELGIHFFAAGHHATERYGVKSLGQYLANEFNIDCEFVDIANPI